MNLRSFRAIAFLEATSFIILLYGSVTRDHDIIGILGPIHGVLFMVYVLMAWLLREGAGWTNKQTTWIMLGAVLPFGGYVVDWWLTQRYVPPTDRA
jgi:integral membrane protein